MQMETSIMVFCTLLCPGMAKQMESSTIVLYYYIGMEKGMDTSIIVLCYRKARIVECGNYLEQPKNTNRQLLIGVTSIPQD